ncbi:CubicO group peptidase (beta-lactamase class C family) [Streptomyces iranensis]|uniref:CubicO group peptidase (Beta-lactamase class C family) n=1 Tax=Streptomyces iranensis TaxID=576784 RepID=A0ABS4MIG7_9ACTN|nr:CubicO group peptidase (beta-lactamase class C family) [Streptomyces iranensis]
MAATYEAQRDRGLTRLLETVRALPEGERPWCSGVALAAGTGSGPLAEECFGWAVRHVAYDEASDRGVELPRERWEPVRRDTVFDLASLTKLFTTIVALRAVERGLISLDGRVAAYAPECTAAAEHGITVRQLLTHTSGLIPELPLYEEDGRERALARLAAEPPATPPGTARRYSDLNFLLLQRVLERSAGQPLDRLVQETVTGPLDMAGTRFNPPASWLPRIAATEDQRRPWGKLDRGMLRGVVHDENAWALGGVAGHAGLFSTAGDLAVLCRALLAGGGPMLSPESTELMLTAPGLGFEVDQPWFMGELAGRGAAGHTGFTGTSLVMDRARGAYLVLLATTVHPRRRPGDSAPRAAAATALARALG